MYENYRYPGEFEERSDVFVIWFPLYVGTQEYDPHIPCMEIVKALHHHVQVHVNCCDCETLHHARTFLELGGVDLEKIHFTLFDDPGYYVRDHGVSVMVDDKGNRLIVNPNWSYYGIYDPNDPYCTALRKAGVHAGISLGIYDIVSSDFVSEGGDREFNGDGILMAIEDTEVRKRNPEHSKEEVEAEYKRLYNLDKIIWLPKPLLEDDDYRLGPLDHKEDGTPVFGMSFAAHIDEYCRFIAKNRILLAEISEEEAAQRKMDRVSAERIQAAYEILSSETDRDGNPFEIIRMPTAEPIEVVVTTEDEDYELYKKYIDELGGKFMDGTPWPDGDVHFYASASYCNFLMCNGIVVGQRYYREGMDPKVKEKDEKAHEILQKCFPDREVIMIDSLALNMLGGGVHCWTKDVAAPTVG